jgi:flagellar basal-body rod protein FlgC
MFSAIGISGTGIDAAQTWINTTAGNLANANDVAPTSSTVYAEQTPYLVPISVPGQVGAGVRVAGVQLGSNLGRIEYQPHDPRADRQGDVRVPAVSTSAQLVGMVQAQEDYQANVSALNHAKKAYQSALTLGS